MTDLEKAQLEKALYEAFAAAINAMGIDAFKRTSLFFAGRHKLGG